MKNYTTALAALVISAGPITAFADYRAEIDGSWDTSETEIDGFNNDRETEFFSGSATYFFQPVRRNSAPLAEQNYISRSSSVTLEIAGGEVDEANTSNTDVQGYVVAGQFIMRELGIVVGLRHTNIENDAVEGTTKSTSENESTGFEIGYFLTKTTLATLDFEQQSESEKGSPDEDTDLLTVSVRHLHRLQGNWGDVASWFSASELSEDSSPGDPANDIRTIEFGGTWYPIKKLGVGASITQVDSDNGESEADEGWSVFAEYFFNAGFSVAFEYSQTEPEFSPKDENEESKAFSLSGKIRI